MSEDAQDGTIGEARSLSRKGASGLSIQVESWPQGGLQTLNIWYWKENSLMPDTDTLVDLVLQSEVQLPFFSPKDNFCSHPK